MVSDKMAEKSSVLVTPKRVHDLLSSFIHKEETGVDERLDQGSFMFYELETETVWQWRSDEPNQENIAQSSRQFLPRNREAFFQAFTWFAKPIELSPLKCAQYGWENTDNDIVKCVSCKEIVCASLPKTWDPDLYAKRCEELRAALVKSHSNICPWRDSPSPDIFLSIPLLNQSEVQGDVLSRCTSLEKLGRKLPVIETCDIESQITAEALSGVVTRQINLLEDIRNDDDSSAINTVCVLSLCGWST
ncbi:zinc finger C3HC-type protein 1-like, partial [Saccoglossus kowalevskii]